ncbi:MAG: DUF6157 family protein [Ginsengibacter sp.]
MKTHTTNYQNTFIEIAEDCPANTGEVPATKGDNKSAANLQFEMLYDNPYKYTSDDVLFSVFATRNGFSKNEWDEQRAEFFSKGQACFRASPLTKRYGFGIHCDDKGKVALYGMETTEYAKFVKDESIKKVKAMRSERI